LDATRPGGRILLFAQTVRSQAQLDPSAVCMDEKTLLGSYSASVDLQNLSADFVFNSGIDLTRLISHRFPLQQALDGLQLAANPQPDSMKIVISPGAAWGEERK
jgi:L-iditol 2-dehydrogenase